MSILQQMTIRHLGWLYAAAQRHLYTLFVTCEPAQCQWRIMATPLLLIAVAKDVKRVTFPAVQWWSFLNAVDCRSLIDAACPGQKTPVEGCWSRATLLVGVLPDTGHCCWPPPDHDLCTLPVSIRQTLRASEFNKDIEGQTLLSSTMISKVKLSIDNSEWLCEKWFIINSIISDTEEDN